MLGSNYQVLQYHIFTLIHTTINSCLVKLSNENDMQCEVTFRINVTTLYIPFLDYTCIKIYINHAQIISGHIAIF